MKKIILFFLFIIFFNANFSLFAYDPNSVPSGNDFNFSNLPEKNKSDFNESSINLNELQEPDIKPTIGSNNYYNKSNNLTTPSPDYSTMFPTSTDTNNKEDTPMVGNDGLPTKEINDSVSSYYNFGSIRIEKKVDTNGRVYYVDAQTGKVVDINSYKESDDYLTAKKNYYDALYILNSLKSDLKEKQKELDEVNQKLNDNPNDADLIDQKNNLENEINLINQEIEQQDQDVKDKLVIYKTQKYKEIDRAGYNPATIENSSGKVSKKAVSNGTSLTYKLTAEPYKDYNVSNSESKIVQNVVEESKKTNDFYNAAYGVNLNNIAKDSPLIQDKNVTNIINAYKAVDAITEQAKNRLSNNYIKCYVSRELIPAYYCPLPGMDSNTYPDYSNVKSLADLEKAVNTGPDDAKETCNSICFQKFSCLNYKILNDVNFTSTDNSYIIFPRTDYSIPYEINLSLNNQMAVDTLSFYVKLNSSNNYNPSEHDDKSFDEFYKDSGRTIKIKMDAYAYYNDKPAIQIMKDNIIEIKNGTIVKINLKINKPMDKLVLLFKKPYIKESQFLEMNDPIAQAILNKYIGSINVYDIKGTYKSDSLWFCPFKQIVNNQDECKKPLLELTNGTSVLRVCTDADHKIGPDATTGAFYTNENCMASCVERKECVPTYRHYKYITDFLGGVNGVYKVKVGCVDSPDNTRCTDKECEELFKDSKYRPNEEIVIQGDDTKVYTVRNKMLTGVPRPRISLSEELNATNEDDITNVFIKEMKDAAYQNMVNEQHYNVIKYKIGEESPRQQAYKITSYSADHNSLSVLIKPDSFKFDDGKNYYLYSVIKVESIYRPKYGVFLLGANYLPSGSTTIEGESGTFSHTSYYVDATKQPLVLKDIMYAIKDPSQSSGWKVFREEYFNQIRVTKLLKVCYDANGKQTITDYNPTESFTACTEDQTITTVNDETTKVPTNCCYVTTETRWVDYTGSHLDRNAFYDPSTDTFYSFDPNSELAPYYKVEQFNSDKPIYEYNLLEDLANTPHEIPGLLFHSQEKKDNGESFRRVFGGGWEQTYNAILGNIEAFNFYSDHQLTYSDVLNQLNDSNKFFDLFNKGRYKQKINSDSSFNNNIKLYKLGASNILSIQSDIKPKVDEENKKVFKFIFLKDFIKTLTPITVDNINK